MEKLTQEAENTVRFQILFGLGMLAVSMIIFWVASQVWTVDIKFVVFAIAAFLALTWLRDSLMLLADVAIVVMKLKERKE